MITKRKREELYDKFRQGAVPSGADFADLIRSQLNLLDDGIDISEDPDDPICLRAHGAKENLLDFSDPDNRRRWRISGRCENESKEGLNITADGNSKLYIERESGNVGISTDGPKAKLHLIQTSAADAFRIDDEGNDKTPFIVTSDGQVGIGLENPSAKLHISYSGVGDIFRVDDTEEDTTPFVIVENGNVGIGYHEPKAKLTVDGSVSIGRNANLGGNSLYVAGNVEIGGSLVLSGDSEVGGVMFNAPLSSKNDDEIIIKDNLRIIPNPGGPDKPVSNGNLSVAGNTILGTFTKVPEQQNVLTINGRIRSGADINDLEQQYELEINEVLTVDRNPQAQRVTVRGDLTLLGTATLGNNQGDDYIFLNGAVKREGGDAVTIDNDLSVTQTASLNEVEVAGNLTVDKTSSLYDAEIRNNLTVAKTAAFYDVNVANNLTVNNFTNLHEVKIRDNLTVDKNSTLESATIKKLTLESGATVNKISTDHALASNSNDVLVTEKAIKTYVDNQIASVAIVYQ